jgi:hypothetical protein
MLDFNKHLRDILYQEDFLIVPGLGAFIAKFSQAKLSDNGEVIGPFKTFDFNGLLNSDDRNKFINYVLSKESGSKSEIEAQLKEFTFAFKSNLSANKKLNLADICLVQMTNEGDLVGDFISETNFYELADTRVSSIYESKEEIYSKETPVVNEMADNSYTEDFEVDYSEKRNWLKYLLYIIPLLLIFGALYSVILYQPFNKSAEVMDNIEIKVDTTQINATIDTSTVDSSESLEISKEISSQKQSNQKLDSNGRFEVSAGIFKNKENADKLAKRMNEAGFKSEIKLVNGMRRVYVSVSGIDAAEAMSKRIEQFTGDKSVYFDEHGISNR